MQRAAPDAPPAPPIRGAPRHELKFVFPGAEADVLADLLAGVARPVVYGVGEVSNVHSVYFDDARLSSCRESIAGDPRRTKVRLRWYDRPRPGGASFFEIKRRDNRVIWKDRFPVGLPEPLPSGRLDDLAGAVAARLGEPAASYLAERALATALVRYRRRHYEVPGGGIRITLDHELTGYDLSGATTLDDAPSVPAGDHAILEVMTPPGLEAQRIREVLHPLRPRLARFSKYVRCCQAFGWLELEDAAGS